MKKAYPEKKFYYVETEALKDVYGVDLEDTIYIKEEEELADDTELVAVISAAIAASEGTTTEGFVVRSINRR